MKTKAQQLGITTFPYIEYDKHGNETYFESSHGGWCKWEYDEHGRLTHYDDSYGNSEVRKYDSNNNIIHKEINGVIITYEYDEDNNLIFEEDSVNGVILNNRTSSTKMDMTSCMLSILDSLKLYDNDTLVLNGETLSEMMFRKMKGYDIDLNKELGMTHLKPVTKNKK